MKQLLLELLAFACLITLHSAQAQDFAFATETGTRLGAITIAPDSVAYWFRHNEDSVYTGVSRDLMQTLPRQSEYQWHADNLALLMDDAKWDSIAVYAPDFASETYLSLSDSLFTALQEAVDAALAREDSLQLIVDGHQAVVDSMEAANAQLTAERDSLAVPAAQYDALAAGVEAVISMLRRE